REDRMNQRAEAYAVRTRPRARDAFDPDLIRIAKPRRTLAALDNPRGKLGRCDNLVSFRRASRHDGAVARFPLFVFVRALRRHPLPLIGRQQAMLPRAHRLARIQPEPGGIPPHDMMVASLTAMQPRRDDAQLRRSLGRTYGYAVVAEDGTSGRRNFKRRAPILLCGIDHRVEPTKPSLLRLAADRRHDQQIARARRTDIEQAHRLLTVAARLLVRMVQQFARR